MHILQIITIIDLVLSIKYTHSFKSFKHNRFTYYRALDSVFMTNPKNHSTSYGIYVVGKTITVDIPTNVVNLTQIVDWKVVNLDKDRLMFVHNAKPQILINQKTIKQMKFPHELTGSIIPFGDSEALHVPTIFNPNLTKPDHQWNYIELLYFNVNSETVIVSRSLPWLKDDDWKFIKEWKMTDYIHFDDKLYLLIQRSIFNEQASNVTQEISIIRLCLNKGSELISSAVEIHYVRPEFQTNKITAAIFVCITYYEPEKILLLMTFETANQNLIHKRYFIDNFVTLFGKTARECASDVNSYTLMRNHLRSEVRRCKKTTYKSCSPNVNTVPSVQLSFNQELDYHFIFGYDTSHSPPIEYAYTSSFNDTHFCLPRSGLSPLCAKIHKNYNYDSSTQNIEAFYFGYPHNVFHLSYNNVRANESRFCFQGKGKTLACYNYGLNSVDDFKLHYYYNHRPFGFFHVTEVDYGFSFFSHGFCNFLKSCIHCMMYGLSIGCIWSNAECKKDEQNVTQTLNYCFGIAQIFPLIFNSSSPKTLTIELDRPLEITASREHLVINAGPNNKCTNIKMNGLFINCSMRLSESGEFKIGVTLRSDRYADTTNISALSMDKVDIIAPEVYDYSQIIILLILGLLLNSFTVIFYVRCKKKSEKRRKFSDLNKKAFIDTQSGTLRVKSRTKVLTISTTSKQPSKKTVKIVGTLKTDLKSKSSPSTNKLKVRIIKNKPSRRLRSSKLKS